MALTELISASSAVPTLADYCGHTCSAPALSEVDGSVLVVSVFVVAQTQPDRHCQICHSPEGRFFSGSGRSSPMTVTRRG